MEDSGVQPTDGGHTRRTALRAGAAVAWSVPVMTILGTSPAHADRASQPLGGGVTPTPPPPPTEPTPPTPPEPAATEPAPAPAATTPDSSAPATPGTSGAATPGTSGAAPARAAEAAELARTGSEAAPWAVAGAGMVAGGAALYALSKRPDTGEAAHKA